MTTVAIIATCDTKLQEALFLRDRIRSNNAVTTILIDVGRSPVSNEAIDISQEHLLSKHRGGQDVSQLPRAQVIELMACCASDTVKELFEQGAIDGIVAVGGSGGTALASAIMRQVLPIGFPKLIVSTIASGDTGPIIGETDITLMYSVVDVAGINQILRDILANAGAAIAGAALSFAERKYSEKRAPEQAKKRVAISMFGVTTPGVDAIRKHLESKYPIETLVFHATGHGGKAMERLIQNGTIDAVVDLTTTEICDHLVGGQMSAGEQRLDAAVQAGIPNLVSLGAAELANFGPLDSIPEQYKGRLLYEHNSIVTLLRLSPHESEQVGNFICSKLLKSKRPDMVQVWIPKGGLSMLSVPGAPFADKNADEALFKAIRKGLEGSGIEVMEDERDVNDQGFARDIAEAVATKIGLRG
ncbi:hypothetical protein CDD82_5880 [Ophiocordyceps australis]|uniref:Uncharacterized protein n=1 Tax=Ophiocordyceps australis TaxID=1399860 RepID=A0A2C5ZN17_9HYPO|nr:hypothetical protein CDD82_5880 [Ophiocordyceps australis]